ncbi:C40 family peptidase [Anaerococcus sp. Marseille-P3915]|uniref:C40 family peptidase n=1 Tax=Anaerococcus sp. Marseille-P3915 TaxID=2057799 RepID=UPI001F39EB09|nr:C40 family peptidase [Anaerococcus sp. Marseille-P3915]
MIRNKKFTLLGLGILASIAFIRPAYADSVMLNKEVGSSASFYEDKNGSLSPTETIEATDIHNMLSEDDNYYKIEYKGKTGFVNKNNFYKLNHTSLINDAEIKKDPKDDSENLTSYTLKAGSKVTILEFVNIGDYVKVSYEQGRFDNEFLNVERKNDKDLLYRMLTGSANNIDVPVETIGKNASPELVTVGDGEANAGEKIGYMHFKDLALSFRSQEIIDELYNYYYKLNHSKTYTEAPIFSQGPVYSLANNESYQATENLPQVTVHMQGSQTGIDLYSYGVKFLGNPYVFGGSDLNNGIDCSGFTKRIYETIGISLPHFAQSQQRYGVEIPFGEEKAGDLVFFGTSLNNITHVGIADGYGNMVHASSPKYGIIISPIRNPISIRRIVE